MELKSSIMFSQYGYVIVILQFRQHSQATCAFSAPLLAYLYIIN